MNDIREFLSKAGNVRPSERQLNWFDTEFYAFAHFSPNTFTNLEWGTGKEDPSVFNPTELDCDQWVEAVKSAGMKGLVLTAKHHDGFCLWDSKYTEHCVRNSPLKRDVVKECAEACERGKIKFGVYLSPWDRNSKYYGTDEYNNYYRNQLTELLTGYGEIFHVWFDGACGEGPNGKKQEYDYESYIELIRKYQPGATIFNDHGPDVRWCGNEAGTARYAEWAVVPHDLCFRSEKQTEDAPLAGGLSHIYNSDKDIGSLSNIMYADGLSFCGSEIDMSIRPGWFWHENEEPHSLERLFNTYVNSVGANCCFNLNVPPTRKGLIDERDVKRLKELGDKIRSEFGNEIKPEVPLKKIYCEDTRAVFEMDFENPADLKWAVLAEDIAQGQRIESFILTALNKEGGKCGEYQGTCIGHKKICSFSCTGAGKLILNITAARDTPCIRYMKIY